MFSRHLQAQTDSWVLQVIPRLPYIPSDIKHRDFSNISRSCAHHAATFLGLFTGIRGHIPAAYTHLEKQFFDEIAATGNASRVSIKEYEREGWTFHAKGKLNNTDRPTDRPTNWIPY